MPTASLRELGLSPLGGWTPARPQEVEPLYTEYWSKTYPDAIGAKTPLNDELRDCLGRTGVLFAELTDVIRGEDIESLRALPEFAKERPTRRNVVGRWAKAWGGFNTMVNAQDDTLDAATILLKPRDPMGRESRRADGLAESGDAYDTCISAWENLGASGPVSPASLFHAAELTHRAAWMGDNMLHQEDLLILATDMYEHAMPLIAGNVALSRQAHNYVSDIVCHGFSEQARTGQALGDTQLEDDAYAGMYAQLRRDAARLHDQLATIIETGVDPRAEAGPGFEDFVKLTARREKLIERDPTYEVRQAFGHEDYTPPGAARPKPSYDLVAQHFTPRVVTVAPAEIKSRNHPEGDGCREHYLQDIVYITVDEEPEDLMAAAGALADLFDVDARPTGRAFDIFRRVEEKIVPLMLAVA